MTVLSDKTIKKRIADNELVPNGKPDSAKHCSYEFTAELLLRGGSNKVEQIRGSGVVIEPAQLVWIRAREEISIPAKMVGLWIQTQTLARRGLLLLNITLIEPGYEGPLSAVLVNFGNEKVIINPNTKIAKVMFLPLDSEADELVKKGNSKTYDVELLNKAANAPTSFLQLQSFERKADDILGTMKKQMKQEVSKLSEQVKSQLKNDLQGDLRSTLLKWGGGAFFGFIAACTAVLILVTTFLPRIAAEYSGVEEIAKKASMVQQAETTTHLSTQLHTLSVEIESLKKQIQADTSNENPFSDTNNTDPKQ